MFCYFMNKLLYKDVYISYFFNLRTLSFKFVIIVLEPYYWCSGLISALVLSNHSWQQLRNNYVTWYQLLNQCCCMQGKCLKLFASVLSIWPKTKDYQGGRGKGMGNYTKQCSELIPGSKLRITPARAQGTILGTRNKNHLGTCKTRSLSTVLFLCLWTKNSLVLCCCAVCF